MTDLVKLRIGYSNSKAKCMGSGFLGQIVCDATNIAISVLAEKSEEGKHEAS